MSYTLRWIDELQATITAKDAHVQFGWVGDKKEAFVIGDKVYTANGIDSNPPSTQTVGFFEYFEPKGTYEVWRENIDFWNDDRFLAQQFGFGMGFGSALMEFLNESCGAVAWINNDSGVGKTMIMYAAVGIWGLPEKLVIEEDDTTAFKMNRAEVMHSIPVCIDEVTNMSPEDKSRLVYQGTSGKQRGRMTSSANVERHQGRGWSLMMQYTSNDSIIESIGTKKAMPKAEAQRLLEYRVERVFPEFTFTEVQRVFKDRLMNNYGHAGPIFIKWVLKNPEKTRTYLDKVQKRVEEAAKLSSENRFWSSTLTAAITGLMIAKELGLHSFDIPKVFKWATEDLITQNRRYADDMSLTTTDILNDFFAENISYILQIKSTEDGRNPNGNGLDQHVIPEQIARGRLVARYETDTKLFFIKPKPLKEWCGKLQINYAHLISEIKAKCGGRHDKVRLTRGTNMQLPPANVIVVKFDAIDDETSIDEDIENL